MSVKCTNQQPTIRVKLHAPITAWHPHYDRTFEQKSSTEWEAWAQVMLKLLSIFTQGNARLMVGYWLDALNVLPPELRLAIISGIARGYGLDIHSVPDAPDTIEVHLVQRYSPLAGPQQTESGLVVPKKGAPDLILPGDSRYHTSRRASL